MRSNKTCYRLFSDFKRGQSVEIADSASQGCYREAPDLRNTARYEESLQFGMALTEVSFDNLPIWRLYCIVRDFVSTGVNALLCGTSSLICAIEFLRFGFWCLVH